MVEATDEVSVASVDAGKILVLTGVGVEKVPEIGRWKSAEAC
jgi:hypothetical protein